MQITRNKSTIIEKREIDFTTLDTFDEEKIVLAKKLLRDTINESYVSFFDYVSYSLKYPNEEFSKYNKYVGCVSECIKLKEELKKIGIKTYFVTCKANGFYKPFW